MGHNPLGGWMIVALLATALATAISGWVYTTDAFWGVAWVERVHVFFRGTPARARRAARRWRRVHVNPPPRRISWPRCSTARNARQTRTTRRAPQNKPRQALGGNREKHHDSGGHRCTGRPAWLCHRRASQGRLYARPCRDHADDAIAPRKTLAGRQRRQLGARRLSGR